MTGGQSPMVRFSHARMHVAEMSSRDNNTSHTSTGKTTQCKAESLLVQGASQLLQLLLQGEDTAGVCLAKRKQQLPPCPCVPVTLYPRPCPASLCPPPPLPPFPNPDDRGTHTHTRYWPCCQVWPRHPPSRAPPTQPADHNRVQHHVCRPLTPEHVSRASRSLEVMQLLGRCA